MRGVYLVVIIPFAAAIVVFCIHSLDMVTMSCLGFSISSPLAVLAAIIYVFGAATGGSPFALLRKSVQAS